MSLAVNCNVCGDELTEPGALMLAPSRRVEISAGSRATMTQEFHLCVECWVTEAQPVVMP